MSLIQGFPPIWLFDSNCTGAPCEPNFRFLVAQNSGSAEDTFMAMYEIYYLGALICSGSS